MEPGRWPGLLVRRDRAGLGRIRGKRGDGWRWLVLEVFRRARRTGWSPGTPEVVGLSQMAAVRG